MIIEINDYINNKNPTQLVTTKVISSFHTSDKLNLNTMKSKRVNKVNNGKTIKSKRVNKVNNGKTIKRNSANKVNNGKTMKRKREHSQLFGMTSSKPINISYDYRYYV
jgi:hypothetical protein